jgi:hypothetical protein
MSDYNARPDGLSEKGNAAYDAIRRVMTKRNATDTGGCKTFYSPAEWKARGEDYGCESELIIVYDGGDVRSLMMVDDMYDVHEDIDKALDELGLYVEHCTGWYAAVYKV